MRRIVRASAEQTIQTWRLNAEEWSDGLSTTQHIAREESQISTYTDHDTKDSSLNESDGLHQINWILLDDSNDILAACETLLRPALCAENGTSRVVSAYGIASVFVAPRHRGHGYASELLRGVNEQLQNLDNVGGSALWSDIGALFYEKLGWMPHDSRQFIVPVTIPKYESSGVWITQESLSLTCRHDVEMLTRYFKRGVKKDGTHWTFLPTVQVLNWHHARMKYMMTLASLPPLSRFGYSIDDGLILWTLSIGKKKELLVLRIRYPSPQTLEKLLLAATTVAHEHQLDRIVIWNGIRRDYEQTSLKFVEEKRTGSLSALRVYGKPDIQWHNNEKFCWC